MTAPTPSEARQVADELERASALCDRSDKLDRERVIGRVAVRHIPEIIRALRQGGEAEQSFEVWQDGCPVAWAHGPAETAEREIWHYASQYAQDGPVSVYRVLTTRVPLSALPPPPAQEGE